MRWHQVSELMKGRCHAAPFIFTSCPCIESQAGYGGSRLVALLIDLLRTSACSLRCRGVSQGGGAKEGTYYSCPSLPCAMPRQKKRFSRLRWYFSFACTRVCPCACLCVSKFHSFLSLFVYHLQWCRRQAFDQHPLLY
jgi:hypothetical protein